VSGKEISIVITIGGLTLCTTKVYKWCKKDEDGKYRPIKADDRERAIFAPHLPPPPEEEWNAVTVSGTEEYYEAMLEGGPPDLDDVLGGELAAVIPIRPQEGGKKALKRCRRCGGSIRASLSGGDLCHTCVLCEEITKDK